ncbi:hypothetical protein [Mycobacterium paraffinicum]|uniref:Uncharacterized protein n=1 Tax=Mycobacterium paraffinicum TaxID=53378 RepID=A0ABP8F8T8_9MYCO|nr:hypothetical protein [Mycobacterium paraffinicum]MCV7309873.1 hypothetical protein [Mycobacterium paraffinicum]
MAVFNPWTRHYQAAWENRAANHNLPMWARLVCYAYGRHEANGHAVFQRGQLTVLLGKPPEGDKPFRRAPRQTVHDAINTAVQHGWLAEGSCMECLVVPGHAIQGPQGQADAPCPVHEARTARARKCALTLVASS